MKYEKPQVEVVEFENEGFMTTSADPNDPGHGHTCGTYVKGQSCASWTTTSFGGGTCSSYNGHKCSGYTDNNHPSSNPCKSYGLSCSNF